MQFTKKLLLILCATTLLVSCKKVIVPDVKGCTVRGIFQAGANCSWTGHSEDTEITVIELIKMLEDGAIVMSSGDRIKEKNTMETLCYNAGDNCTYEMKQYIENMATPKK